MGIIPGMTRLEGLRRHPDQALMFDVVGHLQSGMGQDPDDEESQHPGKPGGMEEHGSHQQFDGPALQRAVAPAPHRLTHLFEAFLFQRPGHAVLADHRAQPEFPEALAAAGPGRIGRRADEVVVSVGVADGEVAEHAERRPDACGDDRFEIVSAMTQIVPDHHAGEGPRTGGKCQSTQQRAEVVMGCVRRDRIEAGQRLDRRADAEQIDAVGQAEHPCECDDHAHQHRLAEDFHPDQQIEVAPSAFVVARVFAEKQIAHDHIERQCQRVDQQPRAAHDEKRKG